MPSSIFYTALVVLTIGTFTEAFSIFGSSQFSKIVIHFNDTICEIQGSVLSINGQTIGNLTEAQQQELENYNKKAMQWSNQFGWGFERMFQRLLKTIMQAWGSFWGFGSGSELPEPLSPMNNNTLDSSMEQEDSDNTLGPVTFPNPPSFCYQ